MSRKPASGVRRPASESGAPLRSKKNPEAVPDAGRRTPDAERGRRRLAPVGSLLLAGLMLAACGGDGPGSTGANATPTDGSELAPAPSRLVVAVVDFSGSQTTHAVRESRTYLEKVVEGLGYGDRFVLLEMYRTGSRDSVGKFVQDMPRTRVAGRETSYDTRQLEAAKAGVKNALPIFFDPRFVGSIATTDVLTTLHIASEYLRDADERDRQLLLLTDMLQSTPQYEFEGARRMPGEGWAGAQAREGLLPDLDGACVVVIGADPTTSTGQRVRRFWTDYFSAAGATLEPDNYRIRAPVDAASC